MIADTVRRGYAEVAGAPPGDFDNVWDAIAVITINENGPKEWVSDLAFEDNSVTGNGREEYSGAETISLAAGGSLDIPGKNFRPSRFHYGQKRLVNPLVILTPMTIVGLLERGNHANGETFCRPSNGGGNQKLAWKINAAATLEVGSMYAQKSPCPGDGWRWLYYMVPATSGLDAKVQFDADAPVPHSTGGAGTTASFNLWYPFGIEGVATNFTNSTSYMLFFERNLSDADWNDIRANPWKPWGNQTPSW